MKHFPEQLGGGKLLLAPVPPPPTKPKPNPNPPPPTGNQKPTSEDERKISNPSRCVSSGKPVPSKPGPSKPGPKPHPPPNRESPRLGLSYSTNIDIANGAGSTRTCQKFDIKVRP